MVGFIYLSIYWGEGLLPPPYQNMAYYMHKVGNFKLGFTNNKTFSFNRLEKDHRYQATEHTTYLESLHTVKLNVKSGCDLNIYPYITIFS